MLILYEISIFSLRKLVGNEIVFMKKIVANTTHFNEVQSLTIAIVFELIYNTNGHPRA